MKRMYDIVTTNVVSMIRLNSGGYLLPNIERLRRPTNILELYEKEACPFCRKVREALSTLDLDAKIHPCPKGGFLFRKQLVERGGKEQVPLLIDPNTSEKMYESDTIVKYLFNKYGEGEGSIPFSLQPSLLNTYNSKLATIVRMFPTDQGLVRTLANKPDRPLTFYNFEASPECRRVRELLCSMEIPYTLINVAPVWSEASKIPIVGVSIHLAHQNKSEKRRKIEEEVGSHFELPYLIDTNTNVQLSGADNILLYLMKQYKIQ